MKLALFDLDHTLIPFDSGMAWTRFLVGCGALPAAAEARYLDFCRQYVAGALDIHAMHRASVAPLARFSSAQLAQWLAEFERQLPPRLPASRRSRVQQHLEAGHLCAIVTATTRLVAAPFARQFGVPNLVATESALRDGSYSGEIDGEPCYREHKLQRVVDWLAGRRTSLQAFEQSWFYSDSASDLPLLCAVTHPVAVHPDARLRAHAVASGWALWEPPP